MSVVGYIGCICLDVVVFLRFFYVGHFFKVFSEFVMMLFLGYVLVFWPQGM